MQKKLSAVVMFPLFKYFKSTDNHEMYHIYDLD